MKPDQFSVHKNPGRHRRQIPFVVAVQSNRFRDTPRRVVAPLVAASEFGQVESDLAPSFVVDGVPVVLNPLLMFSAPCHLLGAAVASLADQEDTIINAIDIMLSRAWR